MTMVAVSMATQPPQSTVARLVSVCVYAVTVHVGSHVLGGTGPPSVVNVVVVQHAVCVGAAGTGFALDRCSSARTLKRRSVAMSVVCRSAKSQGEDRKEIGCSWSPFAFRRGTLLTYHHEMDKGTGSRCAPSSCKTLWSDLPTWW